MEFLDERISVICDELKKLSVRNVTRVKDWVYKEGDFVTPQEADQAEPQWSAFDAKTMHWYGPDRHYWFKNELEIPRQYAGKTLWMHVSSQIDEWDDAKNPQFLFFLNEDPMQGMDVNHREIRLMDVPAEEPEKIRIDLQSYTGILHDEFNLCVDMFERDEEIIGLYYDLWVPLAAFTRMDKENADRMALTKALNDTINLLDLREAYSEAFYASVREARSYIRKTVYEKMAGHEDIIASCIGHTHIDVAWWWTVAQTKEKVGRSFSTVLKLMEEYPDYKFMSSQPQLYCFLKKRYPQLFEKIRQRVKQGRWEPEGGMWVEADCNLTSGESLVRQFLYGKKFFKEEFGVDNRILWLPDVFGYSGALPQIMKKCGIDYFQTTKIAWNQYNKFPYDTMMWRGIDGSEILTHMCTTVGVGQDSDKIFTTYNGMLHPDAIMGGWNRYQQKEINNDILVSYGYGDGGGGPTREMLEVSERMEKGIRGIPKVRQVFARQYFDELKERVKDNKELPVWEGELYFEYHRGTYTSMARNKRANRKSEFLMQNLELLSVMAERAGIPYPSEKIEEMWKTVMINQFHDILPGSSIHEVYEVTKKEYEALSAEAAQMLRDRMQAVCGSGEEGGSTVTIFNPLGFVRDDVAVIPAELVKGAGALADAEGRISVIQKCKDQAVVYLEDIPSKGYRVYEMTEAAEENRLQISMAENEITTPFYHVVFDKDGMMSSVYDLENEREIIKEGERGNLLRLYEDKPIYYDDWNIDRFYTEKSWDVTDVSRMEWTERGPVRATLEIERRISKSVILQKIHFYADIRRIDFETEVDYHEHQHLLKVHFPTGIHSDEATFDIQFGNLKRKVTYNTSWDIARFESCGQKWMDFSEGHYGVSLLNDCKYGYSVKDGNIALTLIKSGIEPNPTCDEEKHVFTYSLYPHTEGFADGETMPAAENLNQPLLAIGGGIAATEFSFAQVDSRNVCLDTVKKAEDGNGIILRMYEYENALTKCHVSLPGMKIREVQETDCLENKCGETECTEYGFDMTIRPYEIKTFRVIPQ
ncbi:MAG: alpha-mannosidase [Butyrivibrio sp.]|jgi:alpha-mannosidase|nr:alpha-mannosidase [Butyrivibrio sp.]